MLVRSAAAWAFTLLTLAARSQAYQSVIRMRNNCTLIVNQAPTEEEPLVTQALANIASTLGVNNTGLMERAYYASAYVDPETLQYRNGANDTNILRSAATVSANDTRVLITSPTSLNYSNLDLALFANNTLDLHNTKVKLNQSTVRLDHDNWVHINNSTLNLYSTKFNFTNFFTWWTEASSVYAKTSVLNLDNILTWWTGSNVKVEYSTFNITSENATAPANYEQLFPVLWINDSAVNVSSTEWMIRGLPLVNVLNSSLGLYNSTLTLKDTEAHFESSFLDIYRSTLLCDNSTILIHEGVKTKYNVTAVQGPNSTNVTAGNDLVGHPLGTVDGTLGGEDIDITLNSMT